MNRGKLEAIREDCETAPGPQLRRHSTADVLELAQALEVALGSLADTANAEDMTLQLAQKKADRVYHDLLGPEE